MLQIITCFVPIQNQKSAQRQANERILHNVAQNTSAAVRINFICVLILGYARYTLQITD